MSNSSTASSLTSSALLDKSIAKYDGLPKKGDIIHNMTYTGEYINIFTEYHRI